MPLPLLDRLDLLVRAVRDTGNPHMELVPWFAVGKAAVHRNVIDAGGEGSVWKRLDQPYQPGRRVKHWIKRKRGIEVEAFVSGFKPGNNGHAGLVGALEFSVRHPDGSVRPIAWVSSLSDSERDAMTQREGGSEVQLETEFLGKRAMISGQEYSARSKRIRHARMVRWLKPITG